MKSGFTLVEVSVVIVIIGLVIGSISLGYSIVHAAELRKIVSITQSYSAAVKTFEARYDCLPGDCPSAYTQSLADSSSTSAWGGIGDGNRMVGGNKYEFWNFWYHLSKAKLINWSYETEPAAAYTPCKQSASPCLPGDYSNEHGFKGGWWVLHGKDPNITGSTSLVTPRNIHYWWLSGRAAGRGSPIFTPEDAFVIDSKMDDGIPTTGAVLAVGEASVPSGLYGPIDSTAGAGGATSDVCIDTGSTPSSYNRLNVSHAYNSLCGLLIEGEF